MRGALRYFRLRWRVQGQMVEISGRTLMTTTAEGALPGAIPVAAPAPAYALYDARSVALATFLGSPVAGGALMAMNYKRLGQTGKGVLAAVLCLLLTGLVILVGWNIPKGVSLPIALALMFGMQ